jgi:hypothetical protein
MKYMMQPSDDDIVHNDIEEAFNEDQRQNDEAHDE